MTTFLFALLVVLWLCAGLVIYETVMKITDIEYKNWVVGIARVIIIVVFWPIVACSYFGCLLALHSFNKK